MAKRNEKKIAGAQRKDKELKDPASYEIGYKKPPKWAQWKPGQSGNPTGKHPTTHDQLREVIQLLSSNIDNESKMPMLERMVWNMIERGDSRDHANILEHGWGKVPDKLELDDGKFQKYHEALDAFLLERKNKSDQTEPEGGSQ